MKSTFLLVSLLVLASCNNSTAVELKEYVKPSHFELVLKTDFEKINVEGRPANAHKKIKFKNLVKPQQSNLPIGDENIFTVNYEAGTIADRYARLTQDPKDSNNQVLHYWLRNAAIPCVFKSHKKGRIQIAINPRDANVGLPSFYSKCRIYLHPDIALLKKYPINGDRFWSDITIQQLWMGAEGEAAPAQISLHVGPDPTNGKLRISASCSNTKNKSFWNSVNSNIELPVGEWITMETGYVMGDAKSGRFKVVINSPSLKKPITAIDVTNVTYNPKAAKPIGLSHWQPLKFYTSDNIINFIRNNGGVTQIYWDDFEYSETWPSKW